LQARKTAEASTEHRRATKDKPGTSRSMATSRKAVSIEEVDDEDDHRHSPPPHNSKHILEGPDDEGEEVIEVHDDVPEEPAESAEAELSESNLNIELFYNTYLCVQSGCPKSGLLLFTSSFARCLTLNMWMAIKSMSLSVLRNIAKANMGVVYTVSWIKVMKSRLEAYTAMPRLVGEKKR